MNFSSDCGAPPAPTNGIVDTSEDTTYQSVVSYSCKAGFVLNGIIERTCLADRTWTNEAPTCDRISKCFGAVSLLLSNDFKSVNWLLKYTKY
ncbi:hypothetical protein DPMN_051748 [Dreissena polymorpha]|uniref:Sushi domain-containing protein n=1 Tax=Dreissena polymorpha TaxID=45954 RepID=A0A9D4CIE5_DREPO|nr:hypothetical protein DPMN_051748 [Dreissena polymorpha]